jgi:signal transduction histidine kinase
MGKDETNLNKEGTGIGLSLSYSLSLLLQPSGYQGIQVESEIDKGSNFFFFVEDKLDLAES